MPYPLVAHQGVGAPFLLAGSRWRLDAVAFLFGTVAPDLPYALDRTRFDFDRLGHHWVGLFVWCTPIAVVLAAVFRRCVAWPLAAHLPDLGPFRLRDVGWAAGRKPALAIAAVSGFLGALTHLAADSFTHPEPWASDRFPFLLDPAPIDLPSHIGRPTYWYDVFYWVADIAGAVLVVACLYWAGRRRARAGEPRPDLPATTPASRRAFWGWLGLGVLVGLAWGYSVWWIEGIAQATMLFSWTTAAGLLVGSLVANEELSPGGTGPARPDPPDR